MPSSIFDRFFDKDLKPIFETKNNKKIISEWKIRDEVLFGGPAYQCDWLIFRNVTFLDKFELFDLSIEKGLKFEKCTFSKGVFLRNVQAEGSDMAFDAERYNLIFDECAFEKLVTVSGKSTVLSEGIRFRECEIKGGIAIADVRVGTLGIHIQSCTISTLLMIDKCTVNQDVQLWKCKLHGYARIDNNFLRSIVFSQSELNDSINLNSNRFEVGISVFECKCKGAINFENNDGYTFILNESAFEKCVEVANNDFENDDDRTLSNINIESCSFANGFYLMGQNKFQPFKKAKVKSINVKCSTLLVGDIHFRDLIAEEFRIVGFNTKSNIALSGLEIERLYIEDFYNYAQFVLSDVRAASRAGYTLFSLKRSNLGKAHLSQLSFKRFFEIEIGNVVLNDIVISDIDWFHPTKIKVFDEEALKRKINEQAKEKNESGKLAVTNGMMVRVQTEMLAKEYSAVRETFRQLKYAMEKNGDRALALTFQSYELKFYRKFLNLAVDIKKQRSGNRLRRSAEDVRDFLFDTKIWQDQVILLTSLSNDFGQNWWKPTWLLLVFATLCYFPIAMCASGTLTCQPAQSSADVVKTFEILGEQAKLWPQLLNPTHNLASMLDIKVQISSWIYLFDFFHRIITAYFIFQIVTAFRKYVR